MSKPSFVYATYIRTTAEKLWQALINPEANRQYWFGAHQESDWRKGAPWKIVFADGRIADTGEIVEIDPLRRVVIKWRNEIVPELKAEGYTRCTITLEPQGELMKLTITHEAEREGQHKLIDAVQSGWPLILASLKSLLETGRALEGTDRLPED
ncbi:MAG TPA: SRPBCC family protein [Nordella sp.]|nr:SRPBCC family protein [Nordella sp.]